MNTRVAVSERTLVERLNALRSGLNIMFPLRFCKRDLFFGKLSLTPL